LKKEEIDHIARLGRLELTEDEKTVYSGQLSRILEHIQRLNELKAEGVEPTAHVLPLTNRWREDEVRPSLPVSETLRNAPETEKNFFRVPKILE
jgi:aspartyl-tRNA(Asn)/glutamyl-tRNA(Gln) amidotransferase subunit C